MNLYRKEKLVNLSQLLLNFNNFLYLTLKRYGIILSNKNSFLIKVFFLFLHFLARVLFYLGIRISDTPNMGRIGHLVCEPLYIELLKRNNSIKGKYFIFLSKNLANPYLRSLLPKYIFFVTNPLLINILRLFTHFDKLAIDTHRAISSIDAIAFFSLIDENLKDRPFLKIPSRSDKQVFDLLTNLGIKPTDWYVCLHIRTDAYIEEEKSKYRNSSFDNYLPAIEYIHSRGGKVVKVGEPDEFSIETHSGLIHYENSKYRNPKNDVLINSHCSFYIGNTSGLQAIPGSLGIPVVGVNVAPLAHCKIWGPQDLAIPKHYFCKKTKQILGFKSVLNNPMGSFRYSSKYEEDSISLIENSSEEILWAVTEMYEKIFLRKTPTSDQSQLQVDFNNLFNKSHYSFHSKTLISSKFLEKYKKYIYI
jgi:putative glycosyltransferase (TIGR04372 family)